MVADYIHEGVQVALAAKARAPGAKLKDFMDFVESPDFPLKGATSELRKKVEGLTTQFPMPGAQEEKLEFPMNLATHVGVRLQYQHQYPKHSCICAKEMNWNKLLAVAGRESVNLNNIFVVCSVCRISTVYMHERGCFVLLAEASALNVYLCFFKCI